MEKSSFRLCSKLCEKLRSSEENQVKVLRSAFSCVLCAIEKACTLHEEEHGKAVPDKAIKKIRNLLKDWIVDQKVIGGSVFGHTVPRESYNVSYFTRSYANWKGKEELKVSQWICVIIIFNARRMRTSVTVLTLSVCLLPLYCVRKVFMNKIERTSQFCAELQRFSTKGFR